MKEEEKESSIEPVTAASSLPQPAAPARPGAVQASLAAKIYFRDQETILQHLKYFDLGLKAQLIYYELSERVWWVSIFESFLYMFCMTLWMSHVRAIGSVWLHIFHVPRAFAGYYLVARMPNTHDMVSGVKIEKQGKIPVD